jgi:hypothetical protein
MRRSPEVDVVDRDGSFGRVVEPAEEVDERRFARSVRADQGNFLTTTDLQVHMEQRRTFLLAALLQFAS